MFFWVCGPIVQVHGGHPHLPVARSIDYLCAKWGREGDRPNPSDRARHLNGSLRGLSTSTTDVLLRARPALRRPTVTAGSLTAYASRERDASSFAVRATLRGALPTEVSPRGLEVCSCSMNQAICRECVAYGIEAVVDFADRPWLGRQLCRAYAPMDKSRFSPCDRSSA